MCFFGPRRSGRGRGEGDDGRRLPGRNGVFVSFAPLLSGPRNVQEKSVATRTMQPGKDDGKGLPGRNGGVFLSFHFLSAPALLHILLSRSFPWAFWEQKNQRAPVTVLGAEGLQHTEGVLLLFSFIRPCVFSFS
jgi:hypothetical protein